MGKGPMALAVMAREEGRPTAILAGSIAEDAPLDRFALAEPIGAAPGQKRALPSSAEAAVALVGASLRIAPRFRDLVRPKQG
jgi:hypothetical protein